MLHLPQRSPLITSLLRCLLLSSMLGLTLACSANLPTSPETVTTQTDSVRQSLASKDFSSRGTSDSNLVYRSDRFKFSFSYPNDFALTETDNGVDLWTVEENRAIQAGEYESGTELPPSISISVYRQSDRVPLREWIQREGREHLGILQGDFTPTSVAEQSAIAFNSDGLYWNRNVVLSRNQGSEVIVIRLSQLPVENPDEKREKAYQQTFEQILSTFQLE